ncbi:MAG: ParA family protein [Williamsia sp.]|nr:ParA family protein [Williamsia sp.]
MSKTISIIQQKGGVGKTTLAVNLAYYFAKQQNLRVAMADADPQGSLTVMKDFLTGIDLISVEAATAERDPDRYDLTFIDTSPRNDVRLAQIIRFSDFILLPVRPGYLDMMSMRDSETIIANNQKMPYRAAIVFTQVQHRNRVGEEAKELIKERFSIPAMEPSLGMRVAYQRSFYSEGVYNSDDLKAREEIESVAVELFRMMQ